MEIASIRAAAISPTVALPVSDSLRRELAAGGVAALIEDGSPPSRLPVYA